MALKRERDEELFETAPHEELFETARKEYERQAAEYGYAKKGGCKFCDTMSDVKVRGKKNSDETWTIYDNISDAATKLNLDPKIIEKCCEKETPTEDGHMFEYNEDCCGSDGYLMQKKVFIDQPASYKISVNTGDGLQALFGSGITKTLSPIDLRGSSVGINLNNLPLSTQNIISNCYGTLKFK